MGDPQNAPPRPDAEAICTRVVARVIQELSCIDIAPDSPEWTDLLQGDTKVGQLAVYRGRSGIERMVSASLRLATPALSFHKVAVFTEAQSLVPHLLVEAFSSQGPLDAHIRVDLLPRLELKASRAYVQCCYAPLDATQQGAAADARFLPSLVPPPLQALRTPWQLAFSLKPCHLDAAERCVQSYVDHWTRLMRTGIPLSAQLEARQVDLAAHDLANRRALFDRAVNPMWGELDAALGRPAVDVLLQALRGG